MNLLILSFVLIIFSVSVLHVESEEDISHCEEQLGNRYGRMESCITAIFDVNQFYSDFESTVVQYSGDNGTIHSFAVKYCPMLYQVFECSLLETSNVDAKCLYPHAHAEAKLRFDTYSTILSYICANNGTVLVRVVQNNGFATVYGNRKAKECSELMIGITAMNWGETLEPPDEFCAGIDNTFECYADYVRDHENSNLVAVSNELRTVFSKATKCIAVPNL